MLRRKHAVIRAPCEHDRLIEFRDQGVRGMAVMLRADGGDDLGSIAPDLGQGEERLKEGPHDVLVDGALAQTAVGDRRAPGPRAPQRLHDEPQTTRNLPGALEMPKALRGPGVLRSEEHTSE